MKRFSAREFVWLTLPIVVIGGISLWAARRTPATGFEIARARRVTPVPVAVFKGANVAAEVKLKEHNRDPNDNTGTNWNLDLQVRAGESLLWASDKEGEQRQILVRSKQTGADFYAWTGAFDLRQVPAEWGAITLDWKAALSQTRQGWRSSWKETFERKGQLVLRGAGENVPAPVVSRDPHLHLIRNRIEALPASNGGRNCRLMLTFQSDVAAGDAVEVRSDLVLRDAEGKFVKSVGSSANTATFPQSKRGQYEIIEYLGPPWKIPVKTASWTLQVGNYWPLQGATTLSDEKGRALLSEREVESAK